MGMEEGGGGGVTPHNVEKVHKIVAAIYFAKSGNYQVLLSAMLLATKKL